MAKERTARTRARRGRSQKVDRKGVTAEEPRLPPLPERNQEALRLLQECLADDSGYDESVWPELKRALERDRLGYRRLFDD